MNNVLAIARKEVKGYFASPIAYIVVGFSAILFGWFFINLLYYFDRVSMQATTGYVGQAVNVNEMVITPLFLNVSVILLTTIAALLIRRACRRVEPQQFGLRAPEVIPVTARRAA